MKMLDEILSSNFKFICLNDNMDHASNESVAVVKEIEKFYLTLFPKASSFELPPGKANRELYLADYMARYFTGSVYSPFLPLPPSFASNLTLPKETPDTNEKRNESANRK
jgi:hypothetical protein